MGSERTQTTAKREAGLREMGVAKEARYSQLVVLHTASIYNAHTQSLIRKTTFLVAFGPKSVVFLVSQSCCGLKTPKNYFNQLKHGLAFLDCKVRISDVHY